MALRKSRQVQVHGDAKVRVVTPKEQRIQMVKEEGHDKRAARKLWKKKPTA
jgi:hypothetical protein